jgi:sec-independent protein translocase protein TatA
MFGPGLGWQELVLILLIIAMIFGTSKLSGIGSDLGKSIREFKKEATIDSETGEESLPEGTKATQTQVEQPKVVDRREMRADEI